MPNHDTALEDFIYQPDTMALILRSEIVTESFLELNPFVLVGKTLLGGFVIIYINQNHFGRIPTETYNVVNAVNPVVLGLLNAASMEAAGIAQVQRQPYLDLRGSGVLLGFVDTGIDYTQQAFIYEDGSSKIQYIWDQSIPGSPPEGYLYGSEYDITKINEALQSENPLDIVPQRDTVGHGTFLASIAGSREQGENIGAAPDSEIIVVKLKRARPVDYEYFLIPAHQENAFASDDFMMGIEYIWNKASHLGRPVAICIGLGTSFTSHNGLHTLEEYLSRVAGIRGVAICAAVGNESQAGHHTMGRVSAAGEMQTIEFRASNKYEDILIHMWNYASDRLSVSVTSPAGEQIHRIPARSGLILQTKLILERSTVIVQYLFPIQKIGEQLTRVKILSATPGIWTITVHGDVILDGTYHAWLPITGFIDPATVFVSPVPNYTIVSPSTAQGLVACGAYNSFKNSLAPTSSWGPTRQPAISPDLVAPGVDVGGIYPAGYGIMSGTSVSAAVATGASALMLQWGIVETNDMSMDSFRVRANLIIGCSRNANIEYPNNQWGYGRLNLINSFRLLGSI